MCQVLFLEQVATFLGYTDSGSSFVFGYLVGQKPFLTAVLNGTAKEVAEQINESGATFTVFMFKVARGRSKGRKVGTVIHRLNFGKMSAKFSKICWHWR